jgi:hypothetical protein
LLAIKIHLANLKNIFKELLSIIGYIKDIGGGKHLIKRGGNKRELVTQGWNQVKK